MPRNGPPVEPGRWRPQHGMRAYRALRRRILNERGWRCEDCGRAGRLELHHKIEVAAAATIARTISRCCARAVTSPSTSAGRGRTDPHGVPR